MRQKGRWRTITDGSTIRATGGKKLRSRVSLIPERGSAGTVRRVKIALKVPRRLRGEVAQLQVSGFADQYAGFEDEGLFDDVGYADPATSGTEPTTLPGLLAQLARTSRNDQVVASLQVSDDEGNVVPARSRSARAPSVVSGSRTADVVVR